MTDFKSVTLEFLKGLIISLILSLILVLIFAGVNQAFSVPIKVIKPVTIIIKILSVAVGVLFSVKGERGLLKGAILGLIITIISQILFSILGSGFSFTLSILWEILLGLGVGAIFGAISVNLKK